jgi:hypothetical protein
MSGLDDHLKYLPREDFTPTRATRRLIAAVQREASLAANKGELGGWLCVFARLSTMTKTELEERGCPADQVEPLLRFATSAAIYIAAPIVPACGEADPETLRETSEFIARIAGLRWGTEEASRAHVDWLVSGAGTIGARLRRDPQARRLLGYRERRQ